MTADEVLRQAHDYLEWMREGGFELDGSDLDIWFMQAALESASGQPESDPRERAIMAFAFAVHIAETLAATCRDVRVEVEHDGGTVREVKAVGPVVQNVLTWVLACLEDPAADNIVFKYAGALRDLGEQDRAATLSLHLT